MICENCGSVIKSVEVLLFDHEGLDYWTDWPLDEVPDNAVYIDVPTSWTGYDLTESEQADSVRCPRRHKFPLKCQEIQTYDFVRVVMFKHSPKEEA